MKRTNKKLFAVLAIVVLMATLIPFSASYAAGATISVDSVNASVGETVSVDVKLNGSFSAIDVTETLSFDKTKLEVVSVTPGTVYTSAAGFKDLTDDISAANAGGEIVVVIANSDNQTFSTGVIATIEFKVKDNVAGEQVLGLTSEVNEDGVGDISSQITTTSGKVNVIVPITSVTLNKTSATLNVGDTDELTATVAPANTTENKTITWTSSKEEVATVVNGKVTAVAPGTATITATAGNKSATYTVEVKAPLTGIALNSTSENLLKGETFDLTVTYTPANTTDDKTITWTSSKEEVATVVNGKVTALKEGVAVITAKVGEYTAACAINVTEKKLESISIGSDFELEFGTSKDLTVTYTPADTTDSKDVTWKSSDSAVVKVENGKVTALKVGEATITATVGEKTASVKVTVPEILIEDIVAKLDADKIEVEKTANIIVATNPEKVTEEYTATFKSSDETIAKVDENGVVTGVKAGKATITVKVNDKFEKKVEVEVVEKAVETPAEAPVEETKYCNWCICSINSNFYSWNSCNNKKKINKIV